MRREIALSLVLVVLAAMPVGAAQCALDVAPASTLVVQHFAFDLRKLNKPAKTDVTTVVITNNSEEETLAHVTVWTDMSRPSVNWDILLAPFGSQEIPIHEIFRGDRLEYPGIDPDNPVVSPNGDGRPKEVVRDMHAGRPVDGTCRGFPWGDNYARGYITIDSAGPSNGFPNNGNLDALTGHIRHDNKKRKYGSVEPLIHLQSRGRGDGLGEVWSVPFDLTQGSRTELTVFRVPAVLNDVDLETYCDLPEPTGWFPLEQEDAIVVDREGNQQEILIDGSGGRIPGFPLVSGTYELGQGDLVMPVQEGTLILNFRSPGAYIALRQTNQSSKRQGRDMAVPLEVNCGGSENTLQRQR